MDTQAPAEQDTWFTRAITRAREEQATGQTVTGAEFNSAF